MQPIYLSSDRKLFHDEACLLKEMPFIGWTRFRKAKRDELSAHAHPNIFELTYFVQGNVKWWIGDKVYESKRGDIFISQPNIVHGGFDDVMHACELYWLHFRIPSENDTEYTDMRAEFDQIRETLGQIQHHSFPVSLDVKDWFSELFALHLHPSAFSKLKARVLFYQILLQIISDSQRAVHQAQTPSFQIIEAAKLLQKSEWDNPLPIELIANQVGLSVSRFHQRFVSELGITPAEYRNRERFQVAKNLLLNSSDSVTDIAFQLGFSSSQYFATFFKKMEGFSPSEYRNRVQDSGSKVRDLGIGDSGLGCRN